MTEKTPKIVQQLKFEEQQGVLQNSIKYEEKNTDNFSFENDINVANEKTLDTLINTAEKSNAGILITDNFGTIQYINKRFAEISGYTMDDLVGTNIVSLQSQNQPKSFFKHLKKTIYSGNIWTGEIESKRVNKETYWQQTTIIPVTNQHGKIKYFMTINEEITKRKEMEEKLRVKENAILSSINAIVLTNLSGKITYVNPSFLKMWSFDSEKKILGKPVFSLWKKGGQYVRIMDTVVKDGGWLGEVIARSDNGRLFPVQMSASIVKDENNQPLSIMASFVDITKQKRMEKNFKKFKKISDEADYGSVIYDLQGTIIYGNDSFAQMHGYDSKDLIGQNISKLFDEKNPEKVERLLSDLKQNGKIVGNEQWHVHKTGNRFPLLVTSTIIDDEQFHKPFVAGTMIDITKMKEAEKQIIQHAEEVKIVNQELNNAREQLATLNQGLEQKVKERTTEINKLLKQKDGFISQLGHDLRTPLTPMFALLPLLEKRVTDEKGKKYVSMIERNSRFMKDLVNKTITYAKLNSDNIEFSFTQINIHQFVNELQKHFDHLLSQKNAFLTNAIKQDYTILADPLQLKEVFQNLISNAIKYKQENKPVHITIDAKKRDNGILQFMVTDDGIGMTEDQIKNVFDEFYKADDARTDVDSHGLGLNICKRIIEKHNGSIWVKSDGVGKGTTFFFTINSKENE